MSFIIHHHVFLLHPPPFPCISSSSSTSMWFFLLHAFLQPPSCISYSFLFHIFSFRPLTYTLHPNLPCSLFFLLSYVSLHDHLPYIFSLRAFVLHPLLQCICSSSSSSTYFFIHHLHAFLRSRSSCISYSSSCMCVNFHLIMSSFLPSMHIFILHLPCVFLHPSSPPCSSSLSSMYLFILLLHEYSSFPYPNLILQPSSSLFTFPQCISCPPPWISSSS